MLGLTGCILAFEYEIKNAVYKKRYTVEYNTQPGLPLAQLLPAAQKALRSDHPATVAEAGYMVGYGNPANFPTSFIKHFGYPPSEVGKNSKC
ncbi:MAG: hypothetical protein QM768_09245 [Agriterribacter sp.]